MMRRFLLASVAAIALAACGRHAPASDTLVIAQQWEPRSLNPALENGTSSTEWSMLVFSYLVKYDDDGNLIPDIATEVPTQQNGGISADGKTITYHIRKGIRFADGTPLTAADAAWSIEAINNPKNNVQSRFAYDDVVKADAPNPTTLVLHLKKIFPPAIVIVGAPQGFPIFPKAQLASLPDINSAPFNRAPFGSGPYVVAKWIPGDRADLTANPYYWRGKPGIPKITVRFVPNAQTALNMLRTHEIAGYFDSQDYGIYPQLQRVPGYVVTSTPQNAVGAIIFNTQDPVTKDARVRHALAEAVDIRNTVDKAYLKTLDSREAGAGLFLWAFDPTAYPDVPYDPAESRRLLDEAGWRMGPDGIRHKNGVPLHVLLILQAETPADAVAANDIAQYERAVGVGVTLKQYQVTQFVAPSEQGGPVYGGKFQMALYSFENGDDPDTTDQFACANVPPNGYNKSRICDPRIDALLHQGLSTYDQTARKQTYAQLQKLLYGELPIALIYRRTQVNAFSDQIVGQTTSPAAGAWWNVANWSFCAPRVYDPTGTYARTQAPLHGPGLILEGGGSDLDREWQWAHSVISGGSKARFGNVVVLRAHGTNDYDPYIQPLGPFRSSRTIIIPPCSTREQVDSMAPYVDGADVLFFSGGDQANYAPWKGSKLIDSVRKLYARGGVEGGTSAGLAIQGQYAYDSVAADKVHPNDDAFEVRTPDALRNPFEPEISITTDMFDWPPLRNVITDTHFARRDRFGRLIAFMARIERERHLPTGTIYGLAVDERSAMLADRNGIATLTEYQGSGYKTRGAYVIHLVNVKQLTPGKPLIATVEVLHLNRPGARLDLKTKRGEGTIYRLTLDGSKTPPYSQDPY